MIAMLAAWTVPARGVTRYQPVPGDPLLEPWRWSTYPELSGLGAQCVTEGTDGTMWFGTPRGVWGFDGVSWTHHTDDDLGSTVTAFPGPDGSIWFGGPRGISRLENGQWRRLFPAAGQGFGEIRKLVVGADGVLWAATARGLLRFHEDQWALYTDRDTAARVDTRRPGAVLRVEWLPQSVIDKDHTKPLSSRRSALSDLCIDSGGRVWMATDEGEVLRYDPSTSSELSDSTTSSSSGSWTLFNELDGLVTGRFPSILAVRDGTILMACGAGSRYLNRFDGARWQPTRLADLGLPEDCNVPLQTRDGVIWLSGRYVVAAWREGRWRTYQKPEVPIPTVRNFLFQSADGALWIGGPDTEVHRVHYQTSRWLTLRDLNFCWESQAGAQWFLHRSGRVVLHDAGQWISYGVEDGVIDGPVALVVTRKGEVWVAGSHQHTAATARFEGQKWVRFIHNELSWGIDWRGVLASSDGSVWFGAAVDSSGPPHHRAGILQVRDATWTHHHQPGRAPRNEDDTNPRTLLPATQRPEPIGKFICLGESPDGRIWAGRNLLVFQDGRQWRVFVPTNISVGIIETMLTTRELELWMGTRHSGALRYDGQAWRQFQGKDSLVANSVRSLAQTTDGSVLAATDRGFTRFDGRTWTADVIPAVLGVPQDGGSLKAGASGGVWINRFTPEWSRRSWPKTEWVDTTNCEFWTVCRQFRSTPPETSLISGPKTVSQPGNVSVMWGGTSHWSGSKDAPLQFSYRLDQGTWSPYAVVSGQAFFSLPPGQHVLEVRARDLDFNVDPTPATLSFVVLPPVWRQAWFILLMLLLGGAVTTQSRRVFLERSRLRQANRILAAEIETRKAAEAASRKSDDLYRSFIAASPDGVAVVDPRGVVLFASARIYALLGRDPKADLTGTNVLDWIVPDDQSRAVSGLAAVADGQVFTSTSYTLVRPDGSLLGVDVSAAALPGSDALAAGIVIVVRDSTARRSAEEEIRKLTADLEKRVQERTAELSRTSEELNASQKALTNLVRELSEKTEALEAANKELAAKNAELARINALFVGRELRMVELKAKLRQLEESVESLSLRNQSP